MGHKSKPPRVIVPVVTPSDLASLSGILSCDSAMLKDLMGSDVVHMRSEGLMRT